ncbi:hypothetical protein D9Q98_004100 [Chlorella vulgaris]|uniref:Uncharacterized protein n=1 Tax=Chlorella vulgaris TaxID=3077 RepID=A0A9D4YY86_CHLVU|nr:hypothetical protein D9Q98_004100 [Chlorella vulgaris]
MCAAKTLGVNIKITKPNHKWYKRSTVHAWYYPEPPADLPGEQWRMVTQKNGDAFPDDPKFDVSQLGRYRDRRRQGVVIRTASDIVTERGKANERYPSVNINGQYREIHELVATAWLGPRPDGLIILFHDHLQGRSR